MKPHRFFPSLSGLAVVGVLGPGAHPSAIGTAYSYQGFLEKREGTPVNDTCTFDLELCDHPTDPCVPGAVSSHPGIEVTDGVITVPGVNFAAEGIQGTGRWMIVSVQRIDDDMPVELSPRVALKPSPHARTLPGLYAQENADCPDVFGGYSENTVAGGLVGATIGGGRRAGSVNGVIADFATVGGSSTNTASGANSTVVGGFTNTASGQLSTVGGGFDMQNHQLTRPAGWQGGSMESKQREEQGDEENNYKTKCPRYDRRRAVRAVARHGRCR